MLGQLEGKAEKTADTRETKEERAMSLTPNCKTMVTVAQSSTVGCKTDFHSFSALPANIKDP